VVDHLAVAVHPEIRNRLHYIYAINTHYPDLLCDASGMGTKIPNQSK
jgi:hypothetical protein